MFGWAKRLLGREAVSEQPRVYEIVRAMPGQRYEPARFLYAAGPDAAEYLARYALNVWVYTAVSELGGDFASAAVEVWHRGEPRRAENHGLLGLLGAAGKPNPDQDLFEFLEAHISNFMLSGNSYWYWHTARGGAPEAVYNLPPEAMRVVPGDSDVVGGYVMEWQGRAFRLAKENVTHFVKYNPFSRYVGLGAMEALRIEVESDRSMALWNKEYFADDVFSPAGILVVDETTSDDEMKRLEAELQGEYGPRRRTMVVRSRPGATVWNDAGLRQRDLEFKEGRLLSRQAVYEALGLPLGLWSESSTEAHARVAERLKLNTVYKLHVRTATKINQDALLFWPRASSYEARFEDVRRVDWQMEKLKLDALRGLMTVDEIRQKHLNLPALGKEGVTGLWMAALGPDVEEVGGDGQQSSLSG